MSENLKIEEKIASNSDAAKQRASELLKNQKKENQKKEQKQEQKAEEKQQEANQMRIFEASDLKINKWGDFFFSKIFKELKAQNLLLKSESEIFFEIDSEKREISFREKNESDKISEKSFFAFYKLRCANRFYFKKAARDKICFQLKILKIEDARFKIQFSREKKGQIFLL